MYEYIADFERWKKTNQNYREKYQEMEKFVKKCEEKCDKNEECLNLCRKPIVDIERFNIFMMKRLTLDVYEICSEKTSKNLDTNLITEIEKMKVCCENLYRESEITIKKETIERLDDMLKFLNV